MSNLMIALLTVFAFAGGLGLGLVLIMRPTPVKPRRGEERVHSEVYFGRSDAPNLVDYPEDDDHPHDIERQGSRFAQRDAEHRYDGMTDGEAPHVPVGARGLDFGSAPR